MRRIVVDTREKREYSFPDSIRRKLDAGDYSLDGLTDHITIERKSLDDLVNTLLRGKRRFAAELRKLQLYDHAYIVVEGSIEDIVSGSYQSQLKPEALLGMVCSLNLQYHPVHIIFAGDRVHAYAWVAETLKLIDGRYP
jgi:ERCC4-type nuclease